MCFALTQIRLATSRVLLSGATQPRLSASLIGAAGPDITDIFSAAHEHKEVELRPIPGNECDACLFFLPDTGSKRNTFTPARSHFRVDMSCTHLKMHPHASPASP